jgi:hypothetical protein
MKTVTLENNKQYRLWNGKVQVRTLDTLHQVYRWTDVKSKATAEKIIKILEA